MAKENVIPNSPNKDKKFKTAKTPEAREQHLVSLALDLAEQQLKDGTASAQVIAHFLKIGSLKERTEKDILDKQKELIEAKTENLKSAKRFEEVCEKAVQAMGIYNPQDEDDEINM